VVAQGETEKSKEASMKVDSQSVLDRRPSPSDATVTNKMHLCRVYTWYM